MLNHTYTSVNNANLVDCGKKQHISSQPSPLLKDNFLGEFRTELDKKKVLANLGIAADLVLEWENIKGDIGKSEALMETLDARTTYATTIKAFENKVISIIEGIKYLENMVGGEQEAESIQNNRIQVLETAKQSIETEISNIKNYLSGTIDVSIASLKTSVQAIDEQLANINSLITVSKKEGNALELLEGETSGLYVPDLSGRLQTTEESMSGLQQSISAIQGSLDTFVTKEQLGGDGEFDFVNQSDFSSFSTTLDQRLGNFESELEKTVKTGEDGHVNNLFVNKISKDTKGNIAITDSFEMSSDKPLDVRSVVADVSDLKNLDPNVCYAGMSVIAINQSAIYILKAPADGSKITSEYLKDSDSWKCPEDLVTQAITRDDYEKLVNSGQADDKVFYYVYEEEIPLTEEPQREDGESEEAFRIRWDAWVESLKILSQQYMSASWGVDIENKLGEKASAAVVNKLQQDINDIKGSGSGLSLESLGASVTNLNTQAEKLSTDVTTNSEKIAAVESSVASVSDQVSKIENSLDNYVTTDKLFDEDSEFIFVKNSEYTEDQTTLRESLATSFTTESLSADEFILQDTSIGVIDDVTPKNESIKRIQVSERNVAFLFDLPQIEVLKHEDYVNKSDTEILEDTYYYTYDDDTYLVTQDDLKRATDRIAILETQVMHLTNALEAIKTHLGID